jgi:transposase-like protein
VARSQGVLVAIGINWDGLCGVLGVEMANRESQSSWRDLWPDCGSAVCAGCSW